MFVATQLQAGAARFGFIVWKTRSLPALFIQRPVPQVVAKQQQLKTSSLATVFWGGDCCGVTATFVWQGKYASEESPPLSREQLALLRELSQKKKCYWFSAVTLVLMSLLWVFQHAPFHWLPGALHCGKQSSAAEAPLYRHGMPPLGSVFSKPFFAAF